MEHELKIKHIGINAGTSDEAEQTAALIAQILGCHVSSGEVSVFAGTPIEVMKGSGRGTHGHIALQVNSIEETIPYFEARGFLFEWNSAQYGADGKLNVLYLEGEFAGFAVHLSR